MGTELAEAAQPAGRGRTGPLLGGVGGEADASEAVCGALQRLLELLRCGAPRHVAAVLLRVRWALRMGLRAASCSCVGEGPPSGAWRFVAVRLAHGQGCAGAQRGEWIPRCGLGSLARSWCDARHARRASCRAWAT